MNKVLSGRGAPPLASFRGGCLQQGSWPLAGHRAAFLLLALGDWLLSGNQASKTTSN